MEFKIGQTVRVIKDDGKLEEHKVKYEPWQLGSGTWVIGLEGIRGGYSLERVVINDRDKKFYSNCCDSFMFHWPDLDICPECGEHCEGIKIDDVV